MSPAHAKRAESMVFCACVCGWRWYNESLKGKSDEDLLEERDREYETHIRELEKQGY